jgi:hypothetical protein
MSGVNFYLSNEDLDRLFYLKAKANRDDLTGNEYAKELLHNLLYSKCPRVPERDENGDYITE